MIPRSRAVNKGGQQGPRERAVIDRPCLQFQQENCKIVFRELRGRRYKRKLGANVGEIRGKWGKIRVKIKT